MEATLVSISFRWLSHAFACREIEHEMTFEPDVDVEGQPAARPPTYFLE